MSETNGIYIAAGGYGSRLREDMLAMGFDGPKHLLPTAPESETTLLGTIVRQALDASTDGPITIYANESNADAFRTHPDVDPQAQVVVGQFEHSLQPFTYNLRRSGSRTLGCAGDFFAPFSWSEFIDAHDAHPYPVSFLVGQTVAVDGGAVFDVDPTNQQITDLRRADITRTDQLINIGAYIFDPDDRVIKILEELEHTDTPSIEDVIVTRIVHNGLAGAYVSPGMPFNINTIGTYRALLQHNSQV